MIPCILPSSPEHATNPPLLRPPDHFEAWALGGGVLRAGSWMGTARLSERVVRG